MKTAARILVALLLGLTVATGATACGESAEDLGIPMYQPSDTVSESTGSTVLTTPDSVEQVTKFYEDFVQKENWDTLSQTGGSGATNLTIKKSGDGATISISTSGSDTLISISTYPSP